MTETPANPAWLEEETARRYHHFTQHTPMYQELSREMLRHADIRPGHTVLDVGCGTGVTSRAVLGALGDSGHVYALDVSAPMLAVAHAQLDTGRVTPIHADAAAADQHLSQPVDRIVCNSVFWQFRHKVDVLAALRRVLAPDGLLVFNAPEPYFIFQDIPRSPKVSTLFKQLAAERHGVGQQDLRTMPIFLQNCGFKLLATHEFTRVRSARESYLFFQLPVATAWMEPPLDYPTRMALLEEAQQLAQPDKPVRQRWMYFVARPVV